ncbi:MAG: hypothetical protein ABH849_01890 [Nanoarchaeota archaeon]
MPKYTQYKEPFVDKAIQKQIDLGVSEMSQLPGVISIMLIGGFGRAEGSVRIEKEKVTPVNDYDLYIITQKQIKEEILNTLAKKIEKKLGSKGCYSLYEHSEKDFYFDIHAIPIKQLKKLPNLIKYYEIKHSSLVIYGKDVRNQMPKYSTDKIPHSDSLRFLLNRLTHITEWFMINYLTGKPVKPEERETLIYDTSKAYMAMATALTVYAKHYKPTYLGRLKEIKAVFTKEFPELNKKHPDLLEKIEFFTNLKLDPRKFSEVKDPVEMWFKAREHMLSVLDFYLKNAFQINSLEQFSKQGSSKYLESFMPDLYRKKLGLELSKEQLNFANFFLQRYLNFLYFKRILKVRKKFFPKLLFYNKEAGMTIFATVPFLVKSLNKNKTINKKYLKRTIEELKKVYPFKTPELTLEGYDELRKTYINAWMLYYFQKLI